jgi:phage gpG-like protein
MVEVTALRIGGRTHDWGGAESQPEKNYYSGRAFVILKTMTNSNLLEKSRSL